MSFEIDPKELSLQDAAGMQLVKLIRRIGSNAGTMDYEKLLNLPKINGVLLVGDLSSEELDIAVSGEQVADAVDAWLEDNVSPETGYVLDSTLTLSNAAAPANIVGELRNALEDIVEDVQSANIFDQPSATLTEGKYLNYTTGNEGTNASYCYVNEYIPVKANTKYFGTVWSKSDGSYLGPYGAFVIFYNDEKEFISGLSGQATQNPFTTPNNCAYIRLSFSQSGWSTNNIMIEESETPSATFIPYFDNKILKLPFVTVDINGRGQYASISDAVNEVSDGTVILVMPGIYEENVKSWGKKLHIIGACKEACIIKDTSGNYTSPPLEIGAGSVQNMSIIEKADGAGTESGGAYAIHIESNNLYDNYLLIRNCYIFSDSSSTIGMGLRGGCAVRIEDCEIICAGARAATGAAPIYFHDADAQAYWGVANLYLKNNVLRNTANSLYSMLTINSIHKENTTNIHVMFNIFVRSKTPALSQKFNTWNSAGNTDADGWNGLSHMYLTDDSFGNNLSELNYTT